MNIKKITAGVLAAATVFTASAATFSSSMPFFSDSALTAEAASTFIKNNIYGDKIDIDESQISVYTATSSYSSGFSVNASVSNNIVKSSNFTLPVFQKARITITLEADKIYQFDLSDIKLKLNGKIGNRSNSQNYEQATDLPIINKIGKSYSIVYDVEIHGENSSFELEKINNSGLKCTNVTITPTGKMRYAKVTSPGENLYIKLRDGYTPNANFTNWAKRLCMYVNSLSNLTGVKHETLFMRFDDTEYPASQYRISYLNPTEDKFGCVFIKPDTTTWALDTINSNPSEFTWTIFHEVAHAYAGNNGKMSKFFNYNPSDEYFANIRGLAAIQNCEQLTNTNIWYDSSTSGKFGTIAKKINKAENNSEYTLFEFLKCMVDYATMKGWNKVENFLALTKADGSAALYTDIDRWSTENKQALSWVNEKLGTNYSNNNENCLRFTNTLRRLYKLANNEKFDSSRKADFKNFLDEYFGTALLKKIYNSIK